jgi:molybdate transport repressor ModE-like protein
VPLSPHVPDLAALELFGAVARYGSIGAAARHAGISQQAASARLRATEAQVGKILLDRDPRGSRLTPAGALLVDWAAPLLAQAGELDSGIASLRRARDAQLRVAASLTIAEHLLPAWLVALRDEYERAGRQPADITLLAANSEAVAGMVAEHAVDLGFVEGPAPPRGLVPGGGRRPAGRGGPPGSSVGPSPVPGPPGRAGRHHAGRAGGGIRHPGVAARGPGFLPGPGHPAGGARAAAQHHHRGPPGGPGRGGPGRAEPAGRARERGRGLLAVIRIPGLDLGRRLRAVWTGAPQPPPGPVRDLIAVAARLAAPAEPG